jgi:hypothetical protein
MILLVACVLVAGCGSAGNRTETEAVEAKEGAAESSVLVASAIPVKSARSSENSKERETNGVTNSPIKSQNTTSTSTGSSAPPKSVLPKIGEGNRGSDEFVLNKGNSDFQESAEEDHTLDVSLDKVTVAAAGNICQADQKSLKIYNDKVESENRFVVGASLYEADKCGGEVRVSLATDGSLWWIESVTMVEGVAPELVGLPLVPSIRGKFFKRPLDYPFQGDISVELVSVPKSELTGVPSPTQPEPLEWLFLIEGSSTQSKDNNPEIAGELVALSNQNIDPAKVHFTRTGQGLDIKNLYLKPGFYRRQSTPVAGL